MVNSQWSTVGRAAQQLVAGGLVTDKQDVARRGSRPQQPNEDRAPAGVRKTKVDWLRQIFKLGHNYAHPSVNLNR